MSIVVVSDTSPIRALAHLAILEELTQIFDQVIVPPAVNQELLTPAAIRFAPIDISDYPFIEVREPQSRQKVEELCQTLDSGEAEAIALALELHTAAILIDEKAGRSIANELKVPVVGTLAILIRLKERNRIATLGPLLEQLQTKLGFFISDTLRKEILRRAGE